MVQCNYDARRSVHLFFANSKPHNIYKYVSKPKVDNGFSAAMPCVVSSITLITTPGKLNIDKIKKIA